MTKTNGTEVHCSGHGQSWLWGRGEGGCIGKVDAYCCAAKVHHGLLQKCKALCFDCSALCIYKALCSEFKLSSAYCTDQGRPC